MTLTALEATIGLSEATRISYTLIGALDGGETGATAGPAENLVSRSDHVGDRFAGYS